MEYKAYPKEKDTPSRKARKSGRNQTFLYNKYKLRQLKAQARRERKEAELAALEETALENE
jgi:hypothetical protein